VTVWTQLWPVRVVASAAGGVSQWLGKMSSALAFKHTVSGGYNTGVGFTAGVSQAPAKLLKVVDDRVSFTTSVDGSSDLVTNRESVTAQSVFQGIIGSPVSAWRVANTFTNLNGTYPAQSFAISRPSGSQDWSNGQNALGVHDGLTAAVIGSLLNGATDAVIDLSYPAMFTKTGLTITEVKLNTWWGYTGNLVLGSTITVLYSVDGTAPSIQLKTLSGNGSHNLATVETFDITAIANTWAKIAALKVRFRYTAAGGNTQSNASVDAVEMTVTANKTVAN
jgi:hypothetical protein